MSKLKKHFEGNNDPLTDNSTKHYVAPEYKEISMSEFLSELGLNNNEKTKKESRESESSKDQVS
jgi:hypothetical protein